MKRVLFGALVLYLGIFALLVLMQGKLIYPFDPTRVSPADAGVPGLREQTLATPDSETLIIWTAKARVGKPTLLYFHGNAGNLANRAQRFERLVDRGFGLAAMAYRGSGGSTGTPSERSLIADAVLLREALEFLLGGTPDGPVLYYGESLGSGVAVALAMQIRPDGLLLEAPYTSIEDLAARRMRIFPVRRFLRDKWDTLTRIRTLDVPLFVLHGTADSVVPYAYGQQVYAASPAAFKHMETLEGEDHTALWNGQGQAAIFSFINRLSK